MRIPPQRLDRLALAIGAVAVLVGVLVALFATSEPGVRLTVSAGRIVVFDVDPHSPAARYGIEEGMVALDVNGRQLVRLPEEVWPDTTPDPISGEVPEPSPTIVPDVPTPVAIDEGALLDIANAPVLQLQAIRAADLDAWTMDNPGYQASFYDDGRNTLRESLLSVVFGIGVLFAAAWWLTTGRAGEELRDLGLPLALATAGPFLVQPLTHLWSPLAWVGLGVLLPSTMGPLAAALIARIEGDQDRAVALAASLTCAAGAALAFAANALTPSLTQSIGTFNLAPQLLTAGITAVPGLIAAGPLLPGARPSESSVGLEASASGRLLRSTELGVVGVTPALAILSAAASPVVFLLWIGAIVFAGRFTVRPLARLASRAQLQRDLVVAATEAERARVAADIHDDALQELTLLVRRLDAAGDAEGAEIARTVSDRLRAICGDLRLPILDDLGVGPALDWLVLRIERLAGGEVRLERADGTRPPADVELAFFRVAQEALANAVKHGRPPIVVRYRSSVAGASLSIDDAGPGIDAEAGARAERDGRFGLLNMQQRAEGIGAILDVRRWPGGGTHVQLEWRPR